MITAEDAQAAVLNRLNSATYDICQDTFVIQSCTLSTRGDYWIIHANSEDFVLRGMEENRYVGVNAYLVSTESGSVEIVGSAQSIESYLQDKYDVEAAGDEYYVLGPKFGRSEKIALINLRQKLECNLQEAIRLVSAPQSAWITGSLSTLKHISMLLEEQNIEVDIRLQQDIANAIEIDQGVWHWTALKTEFKRLIHILAHRSI